MVAKLTPEDITKNLRHALPLALFGFGGLFALGMIIIGADRVLPLLKLVDPLQYGAMAGLAFGNYVLRAWRWQIFARRLSIRLPFGAMFLYYVAGFALTATPGKIGEAMRLWFLKQGHDLAYHRTIGLFLADRLADMIAIVGLTLVTGLMIAGNPTLLLVSFGVFLALAALFTKPQVLLKIVTSIYKRLGIAVRVFAYARKSLRPLKNFRHPRTLGFGFVLGALGWFAEGLAFFVLIQALAPAASFDIWQANFVFLAAMIIGSLAFLPGGLGGTEAALFALLLSQNISAENALVATALIRVMTLWFAVVLGIIALPFALRRAKQCAENRGMHKD